MLLADIKHNTIEFVAIPRKVHLIAVVYSLKFKLTQIVFEIVESVLPHLLDVLAELIEMFEFIYGC